MLGLGINLWRAALSGGAAPFSPLSLSPYSWFDPSDLSTLWQDTAGTTPVTADGQSVARIDDKSGNGRHMIQGTAAARPLYKTAGGLHWLLFDGVDDEFHAADSTTAYDYVLPQTNEMTVAAGYLDLLSSQENGSLIEYSNSQSRQLRLQFCVVNNGGTYRLRTRLNASPSLDTNISGATISNPTTTAHVFGQERRTTSDHRHYVDGTEGYSTASATGDFSTTRGANAAGRIDVNAQWIGMRWYGAVITAPLTTDERAALTTYLGAKAGLTL
jgi:hypothetical protein